MVDDMEAILLLVTRMVPCLDVILFSLSLFCMVFSEKLFFKVFFFPVDPNIFNKGPNIFSLGNKIFFFLSMTIYLRTDKN